MSLKKLLVVRTTLEETSAILDAEQSYSGGSHATTGGNKVKSESWRNGFVRTIRK